MKRKLNFFGNFLEIGPMQIKYSIIVVKITLSMDNIHHNVTENRVNWLITFSWKFNGNYHCLLTLGWQHSVCDIFNLNSNENNFIFVFHNFLHHCHAIWNSRKLCTQNRYCQTMEPQYSNEMQWTMTCLNIIYYLFYCYSFVNSHVSANYWTMQRIASPMFKWYRT